MARQHPPRREEGGCRGPGGAARGRTTARPSAGGPHQGFEAQQHEGTGATSGGNAYRILFAFDPIRRAVLLIGGNKSGQKKDRFYTALIRQADAIYDRHLEHLKKGKP